MIYPVDRITEQSISVRIGNQSLRTAKPYEFEPVPLSPAILEACGFEYIDQVGGWCNKHHVIYGADHWMIHPFCTNDTDVHIKVEYLHQLQNICFALDPTGTELSINLEKVKA